jgi:uncharacterized membrane protein YfcA
MPITDPLFYAAAIPAVLLTGISKRGFGGAPGSIGVPLLALAVSPVQAAAVLLPVLRLMDLVGLRVYFDQWDRPTLRIVLPGAAIGILAGTLAFGMLSEDAIRILVGGIAVAFTVNNLLGLASVEAKMPLGGAIRGRTATGRTAAIDPCRTLTRGRHASTAA